MKGKKFKGQWYIVAAVLFSYSLLTFFDIFNSYSQIDYTSIVKKDEDIIYYNVFQNVQNISKSSSSDNIEGDLKDYLAMAQGNLMGKGILLKYNTSRKGGSMNISQLEISGENIRTGTFQNFGCSDECVGPSQQCVGSINQTCKDANGDSCLELKADDCSDCSCYCSNYGLSSEYGYCDDGKNNDCDSETDYNDTSDCSLVETCNNTFDDDHDGFADCADSDCWGRAGPKGIRCCGSAANCVQDDCIAEICNSSSQCVYANRPQCDATECSGIARCDALGGNCVDPDVSSVVCANCHGKHWDSSKSACCNTAADNWCYASSGGACAGGSWYANHCSDGVKDCDEGGVDCGGADCAGCSPLPGWPYRVPITISYSGAALSGYPVKIVVPYNAHMKSDFGDLRFTGGDGTTLLDYWVESYTASSSATVWVEINSIPAGSSTIYMYYGNSAASSAGNGDATFDFFDDFDGTSLNAAKWYVSTSGAGTVTVSGGAVTCNNPNKNTDTALIGIINAANYNLIGGSKSMEFYGGLVNSGVSMPFGFAVFAVTPATGYIGISNFGYSNGLNIANQVWPGSYGVSGAISGYTTSPGRWIFYGDGSTTHVYINGAHTSYAGAYPSGSVSSITIGPRTSGGRNPNSVTLYWLFIRKRVSSEPTYSIGSEQYFG